MNAKLVLVAALYFAASCGAEHTRPDLPTTGTLTLLRERRLTELLPPSAHYEASGLALHNGSLRVVFDNSSHVADVDLSLRAATLGPGNKAASQYEGITIATRPTPNIFVVKEVDAGGHAAIVTLDDRGRVLSTEPTDVAFADSNKGLEGVAWLDDVERLLVLCEENSCGTGDVSPGHGVIKSLRRGGGAWTTETTLAVPSVAHFHDYSDLAVLAEGEGSYRVGVTSQRDAMLWLGTLTTKPLALLGPGALYGFPKSGGNIQYCSIEGLTFLDRTTLAFSSDRLKDADGCSKAESLHVFALP